MTAPYNPQASVADVLAAQQQSVPPTGPLQLGDLGNQALQHVLMLLSQHGANPLDWMQNRADGSKRELEKIVQAKAGNTKPITKWDPVDMVASGSLEGVGELGPSVRLPEGFRHIGWEEAVRMSPDEWEKFATEQTEREKNLDLSVLGEERLKAYNSAQRTLNSPIADPQSERYLRAERINDEIESSLTPEQQALLFGKGMPKFTNAEDAQTLAQQARAYHPTNLTDMSTPRLLSHAGRELTTGSALGSGTAEESPVSGIVLRGVMQELARRGMDFEQAAHAALAERVRQGYASGSQAAELGMATLRRMVEKGLFHTETLDATKQLMPGQQ